MEEETSLSLTLSQASLLSISRQLEVISDKSSSHYLVVKMGGGGVKVYLMTMIGALKGGGGGQDINDYPIHVQTIFKNTSLSSYFDNLCML